jgi:hypothetical protein
VNNKNFDYSKEEEKNYHYAAFLKKKKLSMIHPTQFSNPISYYNGKK